MAYLMLFSVLEIFIRVILQIFLDTEFADFLSQKLISIGFVSEDGREFYAELIDSWWPKQRSWLKVFCHVWIVRLFAPCHLLRPSSA